MYAYTGCIFKLKDAPIRKVVVGLAKVFPATENVLLKFPFVNVLIVAPELSRSAAI
jgi:hypothetical protein